MQQRWVAVHIGPDLDPDSHTPAILYALYVKPRRELRN